jgi:hypothetical protein
MLDDLRNSSNFIEEEETPEEPIQVVRRPMRQQRPESFLGMTAQQRFILSLMLLFMVLILGVIALVASGSFYIPGLS